MAKKKKNAPVLDLSSGQMSALAILIGVALVGVGAYILLILTDLYQARIDLANKADITFVVVASRNLNPGIRIEAGDLYAVGIPSESVPEGAVLDPAHIVDRYPSERILGNEFVRRERLADPESGRGLNAIVPFHMRALSIEMADGSALSGHLQPGSYVDVIATFSPETDDADPVTKTVLQGLFVMGVNEASVVPQSPQEARDHGQRRLPPSVTLLVTAPDAEKVVHAQNQALIRLTLRNELDDTYAELTGIDVDGLLERLQIVDPSTGAAPDPAEDPREIVKMIAGEHVENVEVLPEP